MSNQSSEGTRYSATFPSDPAIISVARSEIAVFARECGLGAGEVHDVRLAVSEIFTNAIIHAYADAPGEIRIQARREGDELEVVICDDGPGMAPRVKSPGLGLGLPTVATVAADLRIVTPDGGGTEVHLKFACPSAEAA